MKIIFPIGLVPLAVANTFYAYAKPPDPPPKPRAELVIIIEPLPDGMYSTRYLRIEKDTLNEIQNSLGD